MTVMKVKKGRMKRGGVRVRATMGGMIGKEACMVYEVRATLPFEHFLRY